MLDEDLKAVWKRAGAGTPPLTRTAIERLLQPTARRTTRALATIAWTHCAMLALTAVLAVANLPGYRGNATMLAIEGGLGLVALALGAATLRLIGCLRRLERTDRSLLETVERRLEFTGRWYEPWLLSASVTPWLLTLALNTLIDNEQGRYAIHHPLEFAVVTAVMIGITFASLKLATGTAVRELRALAHDLQTEGLDQVPKLLALRRRTRIWMAIGVVLLSLGVIAGILLWLGAP